MLHAEPTLGCMHAIRCIPDVLLANACLLPVMVSRWTGCQLHLQPCRLRSLHQILMERHSCLLLNTFVVCAGHSLGGFTAACCSLFFPNLHKVVTFESPGLTCFYHRLAAQQGDPDYWRQRMVN